MNQAGTSSKAARVISKPTTSQAKEKEIFVIEDNIKDDNQEDDIKPKVKRKWLGLRRQTDPDLSPKELFQDYRYRTRFLSNMGMVLYLVHLAIAGLSILCLHNRDVYIFMLEATYIWYIILAAAIFLFIITTFFGEIRHKEPYNIILLCILAATLMLLWAKLTCYYYPTKMFTSAVLLSFMALSGYYVYICVSRVHFSILWSISTSICTLSIGVAICSVLERQYFDVIFYVAIGALIFNIYIIIDTFIITKGLHYYAIRPSEFVLGAYHLLWVDIIMCYVYLYYFCKRKCKKS